MTKRARKISSTPNRGTDLVDALAMTANALYGIRLFVLDALWNVKATHHVESVAKLQRRRPRKRRKHAR